MSIKGGMNPRWWEGASDDGEDGDVKRILRDD